MTAPQDEIVDFAYNILDPDYWTVQCLGWQESDASEELTLDMYRFIIASIRDEDKKTGFTLRRFLEGPQEIWETIQRRIFQLPDFWDISTVEDRFLQYVKSIVGWTGDTTRITDALDNDALRRLISISVALWKRRGPEDTLIDVISLTTQAQSRIFNWFYYRWLLDVGQVTEDHFGNDIHLIDLPGPPNYNEYDSNLKIVDTLGTLDRDLVKNLIRLMRPVSERYTITYLSFMELFSIEGDIQQWEPIDVGGDIADLIVSNGTGKLIDDTKTEKIVAKEGLSEDWIKQVAYFKIKVNSPDPLSPYKVGVSWCQSADNVRAFHLNFYPSFNLLHYYESYSPGTHNSQYIDYTPWGQLYFDIWHSVRIDEQFPDGKKVYVDGNLVLQDPSIEGESHYGSLSFYHEDNTTIEIDEIEMFQLPLETEEVGINE